MSERPDSYMPFYIGDYHRDTLHLTTRQHGAYRLLLDAYWGGGGPLVNDEDALRAITRETPQDWKVDRPVVMKFFKLIDGKWHQKRADKILEEVSASYAKRKAASDKANEVKKGKRSGNRTGDRHGDQDGDRTGHRNGHRSGTQPEPEPEEDLNPLGSSLRTGSRAAAPGGNAAPRAPSAPQGWEVDHPKWVEFRQKIGDPKWQLWFEKCRVNGSETSIVAPTAFAADTIRNEFGDQLADLFGQSVTVKVEGR